jgi:ferric-dicitrate binding protein FerR (iron transport regulator)
VNVWHQLREHLHVAIATLGLLRERLTHPRDLDDIEDATDALHKAAGIVRRLADSNGDTEMAEIETQELRALKTKKRTATGRTMVVVTGVWALVVGTIMLQWLKDDLYPHLIADGSLEGDYPALLGAFAIAVVLSVPNVFKSRFVTLIEAYKEWKSEKAE